MTRGERHQSGIILATSLIMLAIFMLFSVTAIRSSSTNLTIARNLQIRQEALATANMVLESIASSQYINYTNTNADSGTPITTITPNEIANIDFDGDGSNDYQVSLTKTCIGVYPIPASNLDPGIADDFSCIAGESNNTGIISTTTSKGSSLCAEEHWNVRAVATSINDPGVEVRVNIGVGKRVIVGKKCP